MLQQEYSEIEKLVLWIWI